MKEKERYSSQGLCYRSLDFGNRVHWWKKKKKECFIIYWNCVLLDYFPYVVFSENFGKRYIQKFSIGHTALPTVKEKRKTNPMVTEKSNKIRHHISKQKPLSTAFPNDLLQLLLSEDILYVIDFPLPGKKFGKLQIYMRIYIYNHGNGSMQTYGTFSSTESP